jgi:Xaa-Pro aminopeptidase
VKLFDVDPASPATISRIAARIEDDVLVTENGVRVLTNKVPKGPQEIEALMAK